MDRFGAATKPPVTQMERHLLAVLGDNVFEVKLISSGVDFT